MTARKIAGIDTPRDVQLICGNFRGCRFRRIVLKEN